MSYVYVGQTAPCVDCSASFAKTSPTKIRCADCQARNRLRQQAEKREKKGRQYNTARAAARSERLRRPMLAQPISCAQCRSQFVRKSAFGRYCEPCQEAGKWARLTPERRQKFNAKRRSARAVRQQSDKAFSLNKRMSSGVLHSLSTKKGGRRWEALVGYTLADLMPHLERQFLKGMTWENRTLWHVDHIVPLASFQFDSSDHPEFKAAWAITNLRPLWSGENIRKSSRRFHLL